MRTTRGLRVAVTGAAGFIGRAVVDRIERGALGAWGEIAQLRLNDVQAFERQNAEIVPGSYADAGVRDQLVEGGLDVLFHLASLPGGAAERHPALGKAVNLDGSMALLDALAATAVATGATTPAPVVVYASSIATLGFARQPVNDATALRPTGSYGTHKAMIELYLADLTRRGLLDGRSVRPAGIVARPSDAYEGFATAWMSDLFHAALAQRSIAIPARADAHVWLQSVDKVADNIIHAARVAARTPAGMPVWLPALLPAPSPGLSPQRAWTLPATVTRIDALIDALRRRTGHAVHVEYGDGPTNQPPLDASAALALGFLSDGNTDALVDAVMSRLEQG